MDYYDVLGVSRTADQKEIRQAYRRLARKYHPDLNSGDKASEKKFKEINEAHEVLSDSEARKKYDRYGKDWKHAEERVSGGAYGAGGSGGFDSGIFSGWGDLFRGTGSGRTGRTAAASRLETPVTVSLEDAFHGSAHNVTVSSPGGQRRVEVTVPPGVDTGSRVRFSLDRDTRLFLNVTVRPHDRFERRGDDLYVEAHVPFEEVILGGEARIETLTGQLIVKVPEGTQNGQRIRLAGQGMPRLKSPAHRGDLYVAVRPVLPGILNGEEAELLRKFRRLRARDG